MHIEIKNWNNVPCVKGFFKERGKNGGLNLLKMGCMINPIWKEPVHFYYTCFTTSMTTDLFVVKEVILGEICVICKFHILHKKLKQYRNMNHIILLPI
jgi:hypothetical protein